MVDDLGREAITAIAEQSHAATLTYEPPRRDSVGVTMPVGSLMFLFQRNRMLRLGRHRAADIIGLRNALRSVLMFKQLSAATSILLAFLRSRACWSATRRDLCSKGRRRRWRSHIRFHRARLSNVLGRQPVRAGRKRRDQYVGARAHPGLRSDAGHKRRWPAAHLRRRPASHLRHRSPRG